MGYGECYSALQTFQKNKSPGNDGLTVEFYLAFWPVFGSLLVESLSYAFEYGELSNSQKQAVITLVENRGKDKRQIKNWHPISLINVDAKIASKTLAKRMENVQPEIIHFDQSAFVKGRTIFDAIRTIGDVIEHTMNRDISGILVAIDFEKAFDSLNFSFLLRVLHAFLNAPSFIQWVQVLYNKVSSCVMNNCFIITSGPFSLSRGVKPGDALPPYLFILAIRNDNNIQGIRIGEKIVKLTLFAASSETQGQIVGERESLNGRKNMARRKVKNGEKSTWGQCLTRPVPNGRRCCYF